MPAAPIRLFLRLLALQPLQDERPHEGTELSIFGIGIAFQTLGLISG
jgi:hypothetical protein